MLDRPEATPTPRADWITLCLMIGLVASEAIVLLGMFWI